MAPSNADRLFHTKSTAVVLRRGDLTPHPVSCQVNFCECASKTSICLFAHSLFRVWTCCWKQIQSGVKLTEGQFLSTFTTCKFCIPPLFLFIHLNFSLKNNTNTQICLLSIFLSFELVFFNWCSCILNLSHLIHHFHHSKSILNPNCFYTCMDNVSHIFGILMT